MAGWRPSALLTLEGAGSLTGEATAPASAAQGLHMGYAAPKV